ncbi:MAG: small basic protein [Planctomycetota bacterium]
MSIHKSLVSKAKLQRSRNVWTRQERIEALKKEGKYQEGQSVFGLPKVKTAYKVGKKK